MGKKSKNKQHRRATHSAQAPKQKAPVVAEVAMQSPLQMPVQPTLSTASQPSGKIVPGTLIEGETRQDILRILVLLGIVAVLLVVLIIVNDRTTVLIKAGQHLSSFLKFQAN